MSPRKPPSEKDTPEDFGAAILLLNLIQPDGSPSWAYVAVSTSKTAKLLSFAGKMVAPEEYGKVLLQGEGAVPPAEAREYIYELYGFDS